ncbi:DUF998 domain-containing protein [Salinarimonas rosea]|uniref:DUF998 domain-containing protein n=1 Tax=Salinarimonas rosea TaxID=552063 RepID=UPI000A03E013|nr:DUF998 domain-containing protein [Salinarimonas rosea]
MHSSRDESASVPWTGAVAAAGASVLVVTDLVGSALVPGYDPVRNSISDLAAGRLAWIQDLGLVAFAIGLAALAWGLGRRRAGRTWRAGVVCVALVALDVATIALHDEYGDRDRGGFVIHLELVYALGGLFALATLLLIPGLWRERRAWGIFDAVVGAAWIVLAPIFFIVPTRWDGLYERAIALIVLVWTFGMAWFLMRRRRRVSLT